MEFSYNGYSYFIERYDNESENYYYKRCWLITKNSPKNNEEYENIEKLARLWINVNCLGCKYREEVMKEINKLIL